MERPYSPGAVPKTKGPKRRPKTAPRPPKTAPRRPLLLAGTSSVCPGGSSGARCHTVRPTIADDDYLKSILRDGAGHRVGIQNLPAGRPPSPITDHYSVALLAQVSAPADVVPQPRWQLSSSGASFSSGTSSQSPRCSLGHLRIFSFKLDPSPILSIDST